MTKVPIAEPGGFAAPPLSAVAERWYAVYTRSRHEKKVAQQLASRGVEHFLPLYDAVHRWKDRRMRVTFPLFPGYLFVRIAAAHRRAVVTVPGVLGIVGNNNGPLPVPDREIQVLHTCVSQRARLEPCPFLAVGRKGRVTSGLLAAGQGTRLGPLTAHTPKCLLPVCGRPILAIWLELCRLHGITEVLINTHAHAEAIARFLLQHPSEIKVRVSYEPKLMGSAGTLAANRAWVAQEFAFWVLYADVLTSVNLSDIFEQHRATRPIATLGVYKTTEPRRCGIVDVADDGRVRGFVEKPEMPASDLAFSGLLVASPQLLDAIPERLPADIGYDVLPRLAGRMSAYRIDDFLIDIGTPENYAVAQREWPRLRANELQPV